MKILYGDINSVHNFGGVYRVFNEITTHINSHSDIDIIIPKDKNELIQHLINKDYDIFHDIIGEPDIIPYIDKSKPYIVTIHDLSYEIFYDNVAFDKDIIKDIIDERTFYILASTKIIVPSETTKQSILKYYGEYISPNKINVIYHATETDNIKFDDTPLINGKYILYVGGRLGPINYKYWQVALPKFISFLKNHKDIKLICTGPEFNEYELELFKENKLSKRIIHKFANNDDELNNLYQNAICFVFPSILEGFGLPVLESYKNNCIALLNKDNPCFREITFDSGELIDIDNLDKILDVVLTLTPEEKQEIINIQHEILEQYSWENNANEHIKVYKDCINRR